MKNTLTFIVLAFSLLVSGNVNAKKVHHVYAKVDTKKIVKAKTKMHLGGSGVKATNKVVPLSVNQQSVLKMAKEIGEKDRLRNPEVLSAIILHESGAGTAKKFRTATHKKSYDQTVGLGQIKATTGALVLKKFPELRKEHKLTGNMMTDLGYNDKFNIAIASKYLVMLCEKRNCSDDWLIAAYNKGGNNVPKKPWMLHYVQLVMSKMKLLTA